MGIATGLAEMLGFHCRGIEMDKKMAAASRQLFADFDLNSRIHTGSYFDIECASECYFTYCWPGRTRELEEHFLSTTPANARLLICHGAEDVRCKQKVRER